MTRIKKGGRELVVADTDVNGYLQQGYIVIDEKGNALSKPKAVTYTQAMHENVGLKDRVKQLTLSLEAANTEIAQLKGELADIAEQAAEAPNAEKEEAPETPEKPADEKGDTSEQPKDAEKTEPSIVPAVKADEPTNPNPSAKGAKKGASRRSKATTKA